MGCDDGSGARAMEELNPDKEKMLMIARARLRLQEQEAAKQTAASTETSAVNENFQRGSSLPAPVRALMNAVQGPTFNLMDEAYGGLWGAVDTLTGTGVGRKGPETFTEAYRRNRDFYRGADISRSKEAPFTSGASQFIASLPLGGPAAKVIKQALPVVKNPYGAAALTGGGFGLIGGVGSSEEVGDIPKTAGISTLLGAILGPATEGVKNAVVNVGQNVGARFGLKDTKDLAERRIAEAMLRDQSGSNQASARLNKLGPEATLADSAGTNTRNLLDTMATLPGKTQNATENMINQRQAGRADRLRSSAEAGLSPQGQRLPPFVEDLSAKRKIASAPLYEKLHKIEVPLDDETRTLLRAAEQIGAFEKGRELAVLDRVPFTISSFKDSSPVKAAMRDLDYVKQGMDGLLASSKSVDKEGKLTPFGLKLANLKDLIVGKLDTATTDPRTGAVLYKQARDAYAGPSQLIDSAEAGRRLINLDAVTINKRVRSMGQSEFEAFQVGAFEGLRQKLGTMGGQTQVMNMWKEPSTREKLKEVFPSERAFREFASTVAAEARLKKLESVGRGSQTAGREARMDDQSAQLMKDLGAAGTAAKTGDPLALATTVKNIAGRTMTPENVRDQIGGILLKRGGEAQTQAQSLKDILEKIDRERIYGGARSGIFGAEAAAGVSNRLNSLLY